MDDVTNQIKSLKQKEAILSATLQHSRFSIWSIDNEYRLTFANDVFKNEFFYVFGTRLIEGVSMMELMPESIKDYWKGIYDKALSNNTFTEENVVTFNEVDVYVEISAMPIIEDNRVVGVSFYGDNITERKITEQKLQKKEEKYRNLYNLMRSMADAMPDMLWAKDLNKNYIFANKAICNNLLLAEDTQEPEGKNDIYFALRERNKYPKNKHWHTFGEICSDSDSITLKEMKQMQFDEFGNVKGEFLYLDVHKAPLYDVNQKIIGVVGTARDVTKQKYNEEKIRANTENLKKTLGAITQFIEKDDAKINYEKILKLLSELSGAKYAVFNIIEGEFTKSIAFSGIENISEVTKKYLGVDIINKAWKRKPSFEAVWMHNKISYFEGMEALLTDEFGRLLLTPITKLFKIGEIVAVRIEGKAKVYGNVLLIFTGTANLENTALLELFSYQFGLYLERKEVELKLVTKMHEMERFHKLTNDREIKMVELKKEINELLNQLGREKKYHIVT